MVCPRLRGRRFWLTSLGVPGLGWAIIVLLVPTGWVKAKLTARLAAETGRVVAIGSVRLGWLGNLKIEDLTLAERSNPGEPWLRVGATAINVNPVGVLLGCCCPSVVEIDRAEVRVQRDHNGRSAIDDLLTPLHRRHQTGAPDSGAIRQDDKIQLRLTDSTIHLRDDAADLQLCMTRINARVDFQPLLVELKQLEGQVNGGTCKLAVRLDRDPRSARFAAEIRASKIQLDPGLAGIQAYVPLIARGDNAIGGRLSMHLAVQGQGATAAALRPTLAGHGSVLLDPIDLAGSRILNELKLLGEWPDENHVGAVSANFVVERGRLRTDDLTIQAARLPFVVAGWTDFDGRFEFGTRVDRMAAALPREARAVLGDLRGNFEDLAGLRIVGTRAEAHLTLNGRSLDADRAQTSGDRARFRATARQIRDRFFR